MTSFPCSLKELRQKKSLTQVEAAAIASVSLRSYKSYETEPSKQGSTKYRYLCDILSGYNVLDETHGVLSVNEIRDACQKVFSQYTVNYAVLFGSYAKGKATPQSDVDLIIDTSVTGLAFFGMAERLREALHKKVDLLDSKQLTNNPELINEVLKDGLKIYG